MRYIVDDVDAAIAFYTAHLGFEVEMHPGRVRGARATTCLDPAGRMRPAGRDPDGPAARERERRPRRGDVQPLLRVEDVAEAEQIVRVGAAAVVQDEQAGGLAGRGRARGRSARSWP